MVVSVICINPVAVEIKSGNTVLMSERRFYQRFFNPLFLLRSFRVQEYQKKSSISKKYFFATVLGIFEILDFEIIFQASSLH